MNTLYKPALLFLSLILVGPVRADLNSDLAFSAFQDVDLNGLAGGKVLQARGGLINFQRGITAQALYVIDAPLAEVQTKLLNWNPANHPELEVWMHHQLPPTPTLADFADLASLPDNKSMKYQYTATANLDPDHPELQVSKNEAQLIANMAKQEQDPKKLFVDAWSQILLARVNDFLTGKAGSDYYLLSDGKMESLDEIKSLLHADPKVYGEYQHLFNQTPLKNLATTPMTNPLPHNLYYDVFDIQGSAAMGTGTVYQMAKGPAIQSLDVEYYINSGVYTTIEMEELWPETIDGKQQTLVWRADLVSAPNVAYLRGTERLASGMIMLQEVKQGIDAFRSEFK